MTRSKDCDAVACNLCPVEVHWRYNMIEGLDRPTDLPGSRADSTNPVASHEVHKNYQAKTKFSDICERYEDRFGDNKSIGRQYGEA